MKVNGYNGHHFGELELLDDTSGAVTVPAKLSVGGAEVSTGLVQAVAQADSTATDVAGIVADFNTLLGNLRTAGIIAT